MEIIKITNLTKIFDKKKVVDSVNLSIKQGEIFGLLGPNGAGKTTLLSMLSTLLFPDEGEILIDGYDSRKSGNEIRKKINVVFQEFLLDDELSAYDNLDFYARLYKIPGTNRKEIINGALKLVGLIEEKNKKSGKFSGGMKKRLEIARAILNNPEILFFDEPMQGLDPIVKKTLREYIIKINKQKGTTIILVTHNLEEAEKLCSRIAIMHKGRIIKIGQLNKIKKTLKENSTLEEAFIHLTK